MKQQIQKVQRFHKTFEAPIGLTPKFISEERYELRHKLMEEENKEYLFACETKNITEIADSLGDQLYVLCGTIIEHGMQNIIEQVFNAIHASNMSKLDENGKPIFREDGKVLKGAGYFTPTESIEKILLSGKLQHTITYRIPHI